MARAHIQRRTHDISVEYLRKKELQLTNIGSADIVDANEKLLLGLMWTIILRFAVAEDGKQGRLCVPALIWRAGRGRRRDWAWLL